VMLPSFALGFLWCGCENTFRRGYRLFDTFIDWNP
jgi:hypothetical protein